MFDSGNLEKVSQENSHKYHVIFKLKLKVQYLDFPGLC